MNKYNTSTLKYSSTLCICTVKMHCNSKMIRQRNKFNVISITCSWYSSLVTATPETDVCSCSTEYNALSHTYCLALWNALHTVNIHVYSIKQMQILVLVHWIKRVQYLFSEYSTCSVSTVPAQWLLYLFNEYSTCLVSTVPVQWVQYLCI